MGTAFWQEEPLKNRQLARTQEKQFLSRSNPSCQETLTQKSVSYPCTAYSQMKMSPVHHLGGGAMRPGGTLVLIIKRYKMEYSENVFRLSNE